MQEQLSNSFLYCRFVVVCRHRRKLLVSPADRFNMRTRLSPVRPYVSNARNVSEPN